MADTFTGFLNLTKPEVGGSRDSWGTKIDGNFDAIDTWAQNTDALAKAALSRTGLNKDGNGNTIPWTVAGPVNFSGAVGTGALTVTGSINAAGNVVVPKLNQFIWGVGSRLTEAFTDGTNNTVYSTDIVTNTSNMFRVVNNAYNAEIFNANLNSITWKGNNIWNAANLTPVDRNVTGVQTMAGPLRFNFTYPYIDLNHLGVMNGRIEVDQNGAFLFLDGNSGDSKAYITTAGAIWCKQFGDLNSRIEARAQAFADDRLQQAKNYTNGNFLGPSGVGQGTINQALYINKNYPDIHLYYPGVRDIGWQTRENGWVYLWDWTGGTWQFAIGIDGSITTRQFGDVYGRIELRAQQFADDRLSTATARINNKSFRMFFLSDYYCFQGQPSQEPYGGGLITGYTFSGSTITYLRFRQAQMSDSNGSWYACGYA